MQEAAQHMSTKPLQTGDFKPLWLVGASAPCQGDSMCGTVEPGDCVWVFPISYNLLTIGDVVAFKARGKVVVHRIIGRTGDGLITRGDGNWGRDTDLLIAGNLVGKVEARERGGVRMPVIGGHLGLRHARLLRTGIRLRHYGRWLFRKPYDGLCMSRWVAFIWRPRITMARYMLANGTAVMKFIHRGRTIARWVPSRNEWECCRPFDLVLSPPVRK